MIKIIAIVMLILTITAIIIDAYPSIEVVRVIRCKYCKYWVNKEDYDCEIHSGAFGANDFCSYGERREE